MIRWRARAHQQCDFVLLLTCRTKRDNPGTRRSLALSPAPEFRNISAALSAVAENERSAWRSRA